MQTTVATLLFVTSAVVLACVVVDYSIVACEQTLDADELPQMDRIRQMEETIMNQTDNLFTQIESLNQTAIPPLDELVP